MQIKCTWWFIVRRVALKGFLGLKIFISRSDFEEYWNKFAALHAKIFNEVPNVNKLLHAKKS